MVKARRIRKRRRMFKKMTNINKNLNVQNLLSPMKNKRATEINKNLNVQNLLSSRKNKRATEINKNLNVQNLLSPMKNKRATEINKNLNVQNLLSSRKNQKWLKRKPRRPFSSGKIFCNNLSKSYPAEWNSTDYTNKVHPWAIVQGIEPHSKTKIQKIEWVEVSE